MADSKITALTSIGASTDPANDPLVLVDVSDTSMAASGTTKKVTLNQLLGASGTATLASATITGDLTVDTSTLKVDSTNDVVLIGSATKATYGANKLEVRGASISDASLGGNNTGNLAILTTDSQAIDTGGVLSLGGGFNGTTPYMFAGIAGRKETATNAIAQGYLQFFTTNVSNGVIERYRISGDGVHTWRYVGGVAGTAMTLNSTGLGVGASPSYKLHVAGANPTAAINSTTATSSSISTLLYRNLDGNSNAYSVASIAGETAGNGGYGNLIFSTGFNGSLVERMRIDLSGNVGVGVTPSASWASGWASLSIKNAANSIGANGGSYFEFCQNAVFGSGGSVYVNSAAASRYEMGAGSHYWFNAPSGTAGNAITWTTAMTLDASGNLLVGKTASSITTAGFQTTSTGEVSAALAASTNAATQWTTYSTGAAAYRFYVGMGGTVYATNTTISAISDARFKENVEDIDVGLGAILALKPRKFDWKDGKGKNIKGDRGFIAQEFETVFPNLIDEWKDAAPEGETPYKSVRQDLIPVLVKAIQELTARVQTLEAK